MIFTSNAYNDIINTIGNVHCESGGLLFGRLDDYIVREFVFDEDAIVTYASYTMNTEFLNKEVKRLWEERELACIGFIHSHPYGLKTPSYMDLQYFKRMFKYMPRDKYLVPIVSTIPDGGFQLNPCVLYPKAADVTVEPLIQIIMEPHYSKYGYNKPVATTPPELEEMFWEDDVITGNVPQNLQEYTPTIWDDLKDLWEALKIEFNGFFKN